MNHDVTFSPAKIETFHVNYIRWSYRERFLHAFDFDVRDATDKRNAFKTYIENILPRTQNAYWLEGVLALAVQNSWIAKDEAVGIIKAHSVGNAFVIEL
jgi:hypothetical protein